MVGIAVGSDEDFRTGPRTGGELQSKFMCLPVGDIFRGREGLDILVEVDAAHFSMGGLGCFKLQNGIHPIAVDAADEPLARLFVPGFMSSMIVIQ